MNPFFEITCLHHDDLDTFALPLAIAQYAMSDEMDSPNYHLFKHRMQIAKHLFCEAEEHRDDLARPRTMNDGVLSSIYQPLDGRRPTDDDFDIIYQRFCGCLKLLMMYYPAITLENYASGAECLVH